MVRTGRIAGFFRRLGFYRKPILILATPGDGRKISQTILSHALHHSLTTETHLIAAFSDQSSLDSFNHVCQNLGVSSSSNLSIHHILLETKPERGSFFVHWEKEFLQQKVKRIEFLLAGGAQDVLLSTYECTRKMKSFRKTPVELLLGDELDETYFPGGYTHERWFSLHQDMVEKTQDIGSYRIQLSPSEDDVFDLYCLPSEKKNRVAFAVFLELNRGAEEWFQFAIKLDSLRTLHTSLLLDVHMPRKIKSPPSGISLNSHHQRERKWLRYGLPFDSNTSYEIKTMFHLHSFSNIQEPTLRWERQVFLQQQQSDIPSLDGHDYSSEHFETEHIPLEKLTSSNTQTPTDFNRIVMRIESRREYRSIFNVMYLVNHLQRSEREDIRLVLFIDADFNFPSEFHKYIHERAPNTEFYTNMSRIQWIDAKIHLSVEGFQGKDIMKILEMMNRIDSCELEFHPTCQELTSSIFDTETEIIDMLEAFYMSFNYGFTDWQSALAVFHRLDANTVIYDETTLFQIKEILDDEIQFSLADIDYTWAPVEPLNTVYHGFGPEFGEFLLSLVGHVVSKNDEIFTPQILSDKNPENSCLTALFSNDSYSLFMNEIKSLGQGGNMGGKFPDLFACHRISDNKFQYSIVDAKGRFGLATEEEYSNYYSPPKGSLSKYSIGLQGFPVSIICAQFFAHDDPSSLPDSVPSLDIFLECRNNGFTLKIFDLNAPCWEQGVTIKQLREFLFDEVLHPEKESWRFENWLQSKHA